MMDNYRIKKIDNLDILINSNIESFSSINPNQIGNVLDSNNEVVSHITPIMIISWKQPKNYIGKIAGHIKDI